MSSFRDKKASDKNPVSKRKLNWNKILTNFVLITLILSVVYVVVRLIIADPGAPDVISGRVKSDYTLMLLQCLIGIAALFLPSLLNRAVNFKIPNRVYYLYLLFLYCAIYLGEVRSFYYIIPHWDTVLHAFSSVMLGTLGFSITSVLNTHKNVYVHLSPRFIAIFAFCFAVTIGTVWEIYEFSFDAILNLNMQKFLLEDGTPLIGRAALTDTMKDLIVDVLGAFAVSFFGYYSIKNKALESPILKMSGGKQDGGNTAA